MSDVTQILNDWRGGDISALDRLIPLVYDDLRRLAYKMAVGRGSAATQGTGLVHDLYMRLAGQTHPDIQNRTHFFAVASRAMRQILVSRARKVSAQRRGGGAAGVTLDEERVSGDDRIDELLAVDQALDQLASMNARRAQIIELRYFGGLGVEETAEVLGVSTETIRREARLGEAWLSRLLKTSG